MSELPLPLADLDSDDADADRDGRPRSGIGAWLLSIVLHAVVLALLILVYFVTADQDRAALRATVIEPPPEQPEPPKERDIIEQVQTTIEDEVVVEDPVVSDLDLPIEEFETEDEEISEVAQAKGREEAVSTSEAGGIAAFMAIGAGGGASGAFGNRQGGGRTMAVGKFGGSRASESAVEAALRWFARHQSPNGMWDVVGYPVNCPLPGPKCEPGAGFGHSNADAAVTGYALLCFLGAGYDHKTPNKWRQVVKGGLEWLLAAQTAAGDFGGRNYELGICTMALAEAYAMTMDPALREPTQRAVDLMLARQTRDADGYPLAWDYLGPNPGRIDSSVSGWCVMALKSAKAGGLNVGDGMEGAMNWLERAWKATNPGWEQLDPYGQSRFPYTWTTGDTVRISEQVPDMEIRDLTPVGALAAVFLGHKSGDILLETTSTYVVERMLPRSWPTNTYYMYYNTLAMFQVGGERWQRWNGSVRDLLVNAQRKSEDCFDGSWDAIESSASGTIKTVGRPLVTAYCCLSLEVYYRYLPIAAQR